MPAGVADGVCWSRKRSLLESRAEGPLESRRRRWGGGRGAEGGGRLGTVVPTLRVNRGSGAQEMHGRLGETPLPGGEKGVGLEELDISKAVANSGLANECPFPGQFIMGKRPR